VVQSCHYYNTRPKQRNRTLFTRRAPHSCLKYPAEDFRITSCRGPILLPAWYRDQPEVENPSLSGDSSTTFNTWWCPRRIEFGGVTTFINLCTEP
jgi:hypothetical protein